MIRAAAAETRKLAHPVALALMVVLIAAMWVNARDTAHYAHLQVPVAVSAPTVPLPQASCSVVRGKYLPCPPNSPQQQEAEKVLRENQAISAQFAANGRRLGAVANSLRTGPGILTFVVHHMITGYGWLLLTLLVALHVAGEWRSRTAGVSLLAAGGLRRLLPAKVLSLTVGMLLATVVASAALYVMRGALGATAGIPVPLVQQGDPSTWHVRALPPDGVWSSWPSALTALAIACGVWLVFATLIAGVAVVARKPMITIAGGAGLLSLATLLAKTAHWPRGTIFPAMERLFSLQDTPWGVRDADLWVIPARAPHIAAPHGLTSGTPGELTLWALAFVAVAAALFRLANRSTFVA